MRPLFFIGSSSSSSGYWAWEDCGVDGDAGYAAGVAVESDDTIGDTAESYDIYGFFSFEYVASPVSKDVSSSLASDEKFG